MNRPPANALLFAAGTTAAAARVGALGCCAAPEAYPRLQKPAWAPSARLFGPAWSALYMAIGVAGWRLRARRGSRTVLTLHVTQLAPYVASSLYATALTAAVAPDSVPPDQPMVA